jgi:hypothetical protein
MNEGRTQVRRRFSEQCFEQELFSEDLRLQILRAYMCCGLRANSLGHLPEAIFMPQAFCGFACALPASSGSGLTDEALQHC